jgi:hypothetical protein
VENRAIEIHDSAVDQITLEAGVAVLHFSEVYIHSSEGRPAVDAGTGWTQKAVIRIANAHIEGKFSQKSREAYGGYAHYLSDGSLRINGSVSDNLIPHPTGCAGRHRTHAGMLGRCCSRTRQCNELGAYRNCGIRGRISSTPVMVGETSPLHSESALRLKA